jgi:hypothetical protein
MPKNTKFNQAWLNKTDSDGVKSNIWLKEGENKSTFQCILCKTENLDCSNQGWDAICQHMKTKNHLENIKIVKNNSIFIVESSQTPSSSTDNVVATPQLILGSIKRPLTLNFQEQVTKAEAIWVLIVAQRGYSFKSCDEIGDVFSEVCKDFS